VGCCLNLSGTLRGTVRQFHHNLASERQDIALYGGQKETSLLAELQGNLNRIIGREFVCCTALQSGMLRV